MAIDAVRSLISVISLGTHSGAGKLLLHICKTLPEAMRDMHFHGCGLFDHTLVNEAGDTLPATPVAVAPQFRGDASEEKAAPGVGTHNDIVLNQK